MVKAKASGHDVEITSLRTGTTETYATADGRLQEVEHLRPVRSRIGGVWKDIDNTLVRRPDGTVGPAVSAVGMTFSGGGSGLLVRLDQGGRSLGFSWPTALPVPVLDGNTATYASVLPDVDLQLSSDTDGFRELLVVHTAEAAKSPALAQLGLGVTAPGMTVEETDSGGLEAVDNAAGGVVFQAAQPLMWDSTGAARTPARVPADRRRAAAPAVDPSGDASQAPTEGSKVAPVGVDVVADGSQVSLTPDQSMLNDSSTRFPVYIDPQTYAPKAGDWTMVSKYWASAPQYRFNGDSDAGVGDCSWDYCAPSDVKRIFFELPTSKFEGKSIIDADFVAHETWSASCGARDVELWRAKAFGPTTTWNSSSDNWQERLDTEDVAHGSPGCPSGDVEFDATDGVEYAAANNSAYAYFGLKATDESDKYGWKRFGDDAYLRVTYNRPPQQIAMSQLTMNPGGSCKTPASRGYVRTLPQITANNVTDPDGDEVGVQFEAVWDSGDGKGSIPRWTSPKTTAKKSGSDFTVALPGSLPKNRTIAWYARAVDYENGTYYSYSPWSTAGSATGCYFVWDSAVPAGPAVASGEYPESDPSNPDDLWYDGVGEYGDITFDAPDADVTKYEYGVNEDPSSVHTVATTGGAPKSVSFRPTRPGLNWVTAQAWDAAGNASEITTYQFRVRPGQPERAGWSLDDVAGATQAAGSAEPRTLQIHGTPTLGAAGRTGTAVHFDGTHDRLESDIPVVHTSTGFSVAAWAELDSLPPNAAVIAAQPGNNSPGFELYYSQAYDRWAFNQYSADTASATPVRVMQAAPGGVVPGRWTQVVGTYSSAGGLLSLYVDGVLAGTTPYSTPWDARRGLEIGASSYDGAPGAFFPGAIDDVRIYDRPLAPGEVTDLYTGAPIGSGSPARAVFPLDEPPLRSDGSVTTQVSGRADVNPAVFHSGAVSGVPGVRSTAAAFDGVDDYADTGSPHVDNQGSFSVLAWAKLSSRPDHAAAVASQAGADRPGFELYYSATYGWSFDQYTSDDADGTVVRAAQGDTSKSPTGVWTQLLGSYDAVTDDMRLYVNGAYVTTTSFSTPFSAGGSFRIGASRSDGAVTSFFPGQIDDVRLYDRALSAPEASAAYRAIPIVEGRWKADSSSGSPAVSPDDLTGGGHPLTLGSGATVDTSGNNSWIGTGALLLDGDTSGNGYAQTSASPVHTDASFTASAWVTTNGRPQVPVTVMSEAGTKNNGFTVRYVPDPTDPVDAGSWQLEMAASDATTAAVSTATNTDYQVGAWQNITVVFDAYTGQMRLYVDGELQQSLCTDSDNDGVPDDPSCTERVSWASDVHSFDATGGLQLGRGRTASGAWGDYLSGAVDDVWVFQGVASDEQIATLANGSEMATDPGP